MTIILRGQALIEASTAAALICAPLQSLLTVWASDITSAVGEQSPFERNSFLSDMLESIDYPDERTRGQALTNVAALQRAGRLLWVKEQLAVLEQVWPTGEHADRAVRRIYRAPDRGDYYTYIADPENLVGCSTAQALAFMNGAPLQTPGI